MRINTYDANNTLIARVTSKSTPQTVSITDEVDHVNISVGYITQGTTVDDTIYPQLELGTTASEYETCYLESFTYPTDEITTLYGVNTIWSLPGAVDIEYCADTKLYIDTFVNSREPLFRTNTIPSEPIAAGDTRTIEYSIPQISDYTVHVVSVHIPDTSNSNYAKVFMVWNQNGTTLNAHVFNTSASQVAPAPRIECIYLPT